MAKPARNTILVSHRLGAYDPLSASRFQRATTSPETPMNKTLLVVLPLLASVCGSLLSAPADAATAAKTFYLDPALSCQLSIPTTDTAMRPRATGLRNEGGVGTFVICGLPYLHSGADAASFKVVAASFDGIEHTFSCTGVTRATSGANPGFNVKSLTTPANGTSASAEWTSTDLDLGNFDASVTCVLPNGAAITSVQIVVNDEIGG